MVEPWDESRVTTLGRDESSVHPTAPRGHASQNPDEDRARRRVFKNLNQRGEARVSKSPGPNKGRTMIGSALPSTMRITRVDRTLDHLVTAEAQRRPTAPPGRAGERRRRRERGKRGGTPVVQSRGRSFWSEKATSPASWIRPPSAATAGSEKCYRGGGDSGSVALGRRECTHRAGGSQRRRGHLSR